ncbi:asparagine synthetase B family protein [Lachnoclostridium phytofermentans]|uniref:asparagine synthase-related protein n=1 Tax=Lachnoclostridium phytofermentans TaxID=66219 RepID=UPI0004981AE2|nr:asparagine synthetase B family protein [Lachnoclostridium phytofermentans]
MSAIWGVLDDKGNKIVEETSESMKKAFHNCVFDEVHTVSDLNIMMGCGMSYIRRDEEVLLPIYEVDTHLMIAGDVYLDNCEELIKELNLSKTIFDTEIVLEIYKRDKKNFISRLNGSFSFCIYNTISKELLCAVDPTSARCLYYHFDGEKFYFSTLFQGILNAVGLPFEYNKRWITDFLAIDNLAMTSECRETPYQGIYKLEPGELLTFLDGKITRSYYWSPSKNKRKKESGEYKQDFIDLYETIIKESIQTRGEVSILLSGGLDSTSVACIASEYLREKGKVLHSYTSIPEEGFLTQRESVYLTNERELVEKFVKEIGNIDSNFCDLQGQNSWDNAKELMNILEMPYKALQNIDWIYECMIRASKKGCKILLNGQYGNATVSFGNFDIYFKSLLRRGKILSLCKELNELSKRHKLSKRRMFKNTVTLLFPIFSKESVERRAYDGHTYENKTLAKCYHTKKRFKKAKINANLHTPTMKEVKEDMYLKRALSQIGEIETKLSLATGVLIKDPTRSREMIQFCYNLPEDQFVYHGVERRLIREYMKDKIPSKILSETLRKKGVQSADFIFKIDRVRKSIYEEIKLILNEEVKHYIDTSLYEKDISILLKSLEENQSSEVTKLLYTGLMLRFLQNC